MGEVKLAAIDLGTVSSRLLCVTMRDGVVVDSVKRTVITDLGQGVDASGLFAPEAIGRVVGACSGFVREARAYGARLVCTTLTSAARDVSNGGELLGKLRDLGLIPQVIPGEIEARLTFYGVAHDFPGERISVADSGGGSTELVVGSCAPAATEGGLDLECTRSLNIGCRRVTERFFSGMPPVDGEIEHAVAWMRPLFDEYWTGLAERPARLIAVGGTVTTLVAMIHGLVEYDSRFVHLRDLALGQVDAAIDRMRVMGVAGIASLPGIQPKRAPVILAGAVIMRELMAAGGYERLTVSENSLLAGVIATSSEAVAYDGETVIGWSPELAEL